MEVLQVGANQQHMHGCLLCELLDNSTRHTEEDTQLVPIGMLLGREQ